MPTALAQKWQSAAQLWTLLAIESQTRLGFMARNGAFCTWHKMAVFTVFFAISLWVSWPGARRERQWIGMNLPRLVLPVITPCPHDVPRPSPSSLRPLRASSIASAWPVKRIHSDLAVVVVAPSCRDRSPRTRRCHEGIEDCRLVACAIFE